jgi:hypothetical protein
MCVRRAQYESTPYVWRKKLVTHKTGFWEDDVSKKNIRDTVDIFDLLGVTIDAMEITKRHIKFFVSKNGVNGLFVRSNSSSDIRATANFKGDIKRWITQEVYKTGNDNEF